MTEILVPECGPPNIGEKMLLCRQDVDKKGLHLDYDDDGVEMGLQLEQRHRAHAIGPLPAPK